MANTRQDAEPVGSYTQRAVLHRKVLPTTHAAHRRIESECALRDWSEGIRTPLSEISADVADELAKAKCRDPVYPSTSTTRGVEPT